MDQTPATGSVTPFPEPCGLGGELVASLGQYQQPQDRQETESPSPSCPPHLTPCDAKWPPASSDNKEVATLITK